MADESDAPRIAYRLADRICASRVQRQIGIWGAAVPARRRTELAQLIADELHLEEIQALLLEARDRADQAAAQRIDRVLAILRR